MKRYYPEDLNFLVHIYIIKNCFLKLYLKLNFITDETDEMKQLT